MLGEIKIVNGNGAQAQTARPMDKRNAGDNGTRAGSLKAELDALIAAQLEQIRPSIFILLGGSGQQAGVNLKAKLLKTYGLAYREKIVLLAFDSTEEPVAALLDGEPVRLEPASEFFNIGQVPIARIKHNLERHRAIRERLGAQIDRLPSVMRGHGMKMIRPAALVAYHWHYHLIHQELSKAIWRLAGRDVGGPQAVDQQQGINIYIVGSLVGGTGSGLMLDMAYHVRSLLAELGVQSEYCTVTGLGVLAQAFRGVSGRNLYANGGAALKELGHLMLNESFRARYPDGRVIEMHEAPFNLFYVLDGVDERGRTWNGIQEVAAMAADGLFLQMASQVGRRGDNAFDNVDEVLIGRSPDGEATFLSSFGLGYLEFDAPAVADLFTGRLLREFIIDCWLGKAGQDTDGAAEHTQRVAASRVTPALRTDPETGGELFIDLRLPAWLTEKRHDVIPNEAAQYVRAYGRVRVGEEMTAQINRNAQQVLDAEQARWDEWLAGSLFAPDVSLNAVAGSHKQAQTILAERLAAGQRRQAEMDTEVERLTLALQQAEANLAQTASSLPLGRAGRIRQALAGYFQAAEALFDRQLQQAELRGLSTVWGGLAQHLAGRGRAVRFLCERLAAIGEELQHEGDAERRRLQTSGGSRLSLADEAYLERLYSRFRPESVTLSGAVRGPDALAHWGALDTDELKRLLLGRLATAFDPVRAMSVEDVLREQAHETSPKARRKQLFQLATPSWSIDHTRLPDGGANLERLEILGVANEADTLFKDDIARVSTHDPHRIIAYVMVAGAAPSALQQYEQYSRALERMRGVLPVHVLPEFMTEVNQGQLAFALGSIFQLIQNEGAHFYYQPADELAERARLGQGLANAVEFLSAQELLTREILDRVDSRIAHLGLQRSIEILAEYYTTVPDGRSKLDAIARELKRQVREYVDELRQIREFNGGLQE